MKYAVLFVSGAALALSACQKSEAPAPDASAAATAEATEATAAAPAAAVATAVAAGQPPSKDFLVGTWGEGDACAQPLNFQADGTIKDGPFPTWTLENGQLVLGGLIKMTLAVVDEKTMKATREDGTETVTLKRCG